MKLLTLAVAMLLGSFALAQKSELRRVEPVPLRDNAVMLVPLVPNSEGWAFLKAPNGTSGIFPISKVTEAFEAGYKPITVGDLVDAAATGVKIIQEPQKRLSDWASDYDRLVARYNRLAAINATPPVQTQPAPDNSQVMKMLLLQSLFQRTPDPIQIDMRTMDCTRLPALCVGH